MDKMIFIVGASRSGTTMLNRILGLHSGILALNELHYFGDIWQPSSGTLDTSALTDMCQSLLARYHHGIWNERSGLGDMDVSNEIVSALALDQRDGYQLFRAVMAYISSESKIPVICEQTPRNIFYAKNILDHYPDAYVIHLVRDPRAVLASQKNRWKRKFLGGKDIPWPEIIRVWVNYHPVTMSKLWNRACAVGGSIKGHPRYFDVKFEDIVSSPESTIIEICKFLEVEFQKNMLDVPKVGSSMRTNSEESKGVSLEVVSAWRDRLTSGEIYISEKVNCAGMGSHGYISDGGKPPLLSLAYNFVLFPIHMFGVIVTNPSRVLVQLRAYFNR